MQFSDLYGTQLDIELGSGDRTNLFTAARRKKAINDAMHNFERITACTQVFGTISVVNQATAAAVTGTASGGTGYLVNDVLTLTGGTFTTAARFTVSAVSGGVVTAVTFLLAGSYTVLPTGPVSTSGGTGSGCTLNVTWAGTSEYDLLLNFSNYISMADRGEPAIKKVDPNGNISYIQGDSLSRRHVFWNDVEAPGWRADPSSTPTNWYIRDDAGTTFLGLDPPPLMPVGWTYTLLVPILASSTDMVADTDLPFTVNGKSFARLVPFQQGLVHYAAGLLEPLRKNYPAADRQMKLYAGYVAQFETKKLKDGTDQVVFARHYFREAGHPSPIFGIRGVDPHRFP